ncbi:MAG: efflux RND transporter permease subunit, partial [Balneolaceae bacterium]
EKLNSLSGGTLPEGVQPALGPDATALGQIFWYTLEGYDKDGNPTGGWDPQDLRSIQDFQVRYALNAIEGVSEVASIGGFVKEYQVDIDPVAMREAGVSVNDIANAVRESNLDIGARTIEMNRAEYLVRGLGYIESLEDLEESVVAVRNNTPILIRDVARVAMGPAQRRGALDKAGVEATGGVVIARYGENPLKVINNVKEAIERISVGLPSKELADGTVSQVKIVPFYDRTGLIYETLGTLEEALFHEILIAIIVIIIMVMHLRTSVVISALLPIAILMTFIMMKYIGVDANVVALAGIAISIGVVVEMGVILTENMLQHMEEKDPEEDLLETIYRATAEVSPAVVTALLTTIVSFLPVFMLEAQEGRLFGPLAWTKTFILIATLIIVLTLLPAFAHWLFSQKIGKRKWQLLLNGMMIASGLYLAIVYTGWAGLLLMALGFSNLVGIYREEYKPWVSPVNNGMILLAVTWLLAGEWLPLGPENPISLSLLFIILTIGSVFGLFWVFMKYYKPIIDWVLHHKVLFLSLPVLVIIVGLMSWRGLGQEFMPTLDEGSFLLMPTAMPHAGVEEALQLTREMDMRIASIPEVETVVGKIGRAETALDPAPVSMFENVIMYKSQFKTDERGHRIRYKFEDGEYARDYQGELVPDNRGRYFRQWRDHIRSEDDIWNEILLAAELPGITSAPKLQPIETRLIMLQTGMRGSMGIRISGPDLESIDDFATSVEPLLREVEGVRPSAVFADRVVGKPYLEIDIDRQAIARHGLTIQDVQQVISIAVGGQMLGMTVEGRERYPIRARYAREYRNNPDEINRILVPSPDGSQIPLGQLADINFDAGPMNIRSENTFLSAYVIFDRFPDHAPIDVINRVREHLDQSISEGSLDVPDGVSFTFEGEFKNQQRAAERLSVVLPITLLIIFLIIYFQFRSVQVSLIVFSGIALVWCGGFILLWLYGESWFLNFSILGL